MGSYNGNRPVWKAALAGAAALLLALAPTPALGASEVDPVIAEGVGCGLEAFVQAWEKPVDAVSVTAQREAEERREQQGQPEASEPQEASAEPTSEQPEEGASAQEAAPADAAAEEPAASAEEPQEESPETSAWHVTYHSCYGASEAPADGSMGEWAPGYYIAHDWSSNGAMIAACPAYVEVDGQLYRFAGSATYTRDTYYEDGPEAFSHAGGGIGFQTCYGDVYLVTHYVPC